MADFEIERVYFPAVCYDFFRRLQLEKLDKQLFYDGAFKNPSDFANWFEAASSAKQLEMYVVRDVETRDVLGMYHLTGFLGRAAFFHFAFFKESKGRREVIAAEVLKLEMTRRTTLIGLTPYKHVALFAQKAGFVLLDILPGVCTMPDGSTRPGYALAYYKKDIEGALNMGGEESGRLRQGVSRGRNKLGL